VSYAWRSANREKVRALDRARYAANREKICAQLTSPTLTPADLVKLALEHLIDARVEVKLKALGIGAVTPTRAQMRIRAGYLSQRELETAAQLSSGYVTQYELGRVKRPGCRNRAGLDRICAALHCTAEEYILARAES
jgi:DNA-binding Xre family transcriptional regulator